MSRIKQVFVIVNMESKLKLLSNRDTLIARLGTTAIKGGLILTR